MLEWRITLWQEAPHVAPSTKHLHPIMFHRSWWPSVSKYTSKQKWTHFKNLSTSQTWNCEQYKCFPGRCFYGDDKARNMLLITSTEWSRKKKKLESHHLISSISRHPPGVSACSLLFGVTRCSCSPHDTLCVCVSVCLIVCRCFNPGAKCGFVCNNVQVLNSVSSGAVYIHPRRHSRGLSVRGNGHPRLRVQGCFLWAHPHRLADQLVTSEGRVPGKPE